MIWFIWFLINLLALFIIGGIKFEKKYQRYGSLFYFAVFKEKTKLPYWVCVVLEIILDIILPIISIPWYLFVITRFLKD